MRYIKNLILIIALFTFFSVSAQKNIEFEKSNFPDNKKELKQAIKYIEEGDEIIMAFNPNFKMAFDFYKKANDFNPSNAVLNFKLGYCSYYSGKIKDAISYLEKSESLGVQIDTFKLILGKAYHSNYEFKKALKAYDELNSSLGPDKSKKYNDEIMKLKQESNTAISLLENPIRVFIDNIGSEINSKYPEYGPKINADESEIYFTSRKPASGQEASASLSDYFEDIYKSEKRKGEWLVAMKLESPINSKYHDAIIGLSADGQKLVVFKGDNGGDIYISELEGDEWSKPKAISKNINTPYHEADGSFSFDYLKFYYVSDKDGGYGEHDIYVSSKNEKGKWEEPVNIGPVINTKYDERGIFALPDGKTFYFSSNGHNTMGGYDIFKTTYENGKWTKPVNLGYPINTTGDDLYFTISASGKNGYYSSSLNKDSYGSHDIYKISFRGPEMPVINSNEDNLLAISNAASKLDIVDPMVEIKTTNVTILKGKIYDQYTDDPLFAEIVLTDLQTNKVIATFQSNKSSGKYLVTLPSGKNYGIAVKAEDCLFHSENINIQDANTEFQEIVKDIALKRIAVGSSVILKNIFFDTGKSTLRDESKTELENLLNMMNEVPTLKIEIQGHTDNVGSNSSNQKLSEDRAKAVVDYLVDNGISMDRLTYKGYGEDKPIASNDTKEGKQQNRRTEFLVLSR